MKFRTIGAHWYSRKQTLLQCTEQTLSFLLCLKEHNSELFSVWYEKGFSKGEAMTNQIKFDYESIKRLFTKRAKDNDYPKISYSCGLWNGHPDDGQAAAISFSLGSSESKYFTNNCVLELPYEGIQHSFYKEEKHQKELISLFKKQWNPDWIAVDEVVIQKS